MNKPGMILILYKGKELTPVTSVAIAEACKRYGIVDTTEDLAIVYKDDKGIADIIAGANIVPDTDTAQQKAIEEAVNFIGLRFKVQLTRGMASKDFTGFGIALAIAGDREEAVKRAIKVIATKKGKISKDLQLNNNFNDEVVDIIKRVYKFESD